MMNDAILAAGFWIGLHLLLIWVLGLGVTRLRIKLSIGTGHGGNESLERAVRAHGNATEHLPGLLLGLAIMSAIGTSSLWIHLLGGALFTARVLHAYGIQVQGKPLPITRGSGNVLTWLVTLAVSGSLVWSFVIHTL